MKRLTDPTFKYTSSAATDIRKTFARVRREMRAQQTPAPANVVDLPKVVIRRSPK